MKTALPLFGYTALAALVIGFTFLIIIKFSAGIVIWLFVIALEVSLLALAFLCYN